MARAKRSPNGRLHKVPTGIKGLDEITEGGLPQGRPTLVCGGAGCGKTLLAMEFLVRGALEHGEPGVAVSFEETGDELTQNIASFGYDLDDLVKRKLIALDHVRLERHEIHETGEYDLEGLFIRLGLAIDTLGAKRVLIDTLEALFTGLGDTTLLRAELRRLFDWLKSKKVTAIITGERGEGTLTRYGLEEYVADCVILLDHRVSEQVSTRRLRIVKYRGSMHGTNEYPFLISPQGISVLPVTSLKLDHIASTDRVSTGVPRLDHMLGGAGYYRGSSVLVSGTAGTGKTSLAAQFAEASCRRGERCLYFAFEESPSQLMRNMRSIGIELEPWQKQGLLRFHAMRPTAHGLEMHLVALHDVIAEFEPSVVIFDPITNLTTVGSVVEVKAMLTRLIDFLKARQVTTLFTSLTLGSGDLEETSIGVSSLMDTWLLVRFVETNGERNRLLNVLKARGIAHSNQVREFLLTAQGLDLRDVYVGEGGVMTGTARSIQEAQESADAQLHQQTLEQRRRALERKTTAIEAQISALHAELAAEQDEFAQGQAHDQWQRDALVQRRADVSRLRKADMAASVSPKNKSTPRGRKA